MEFFRMREEGCISLPGMNPGLQTLTPAGNTRDGSEATNDLKHSERMPLSGGWWSI
jgi:hypothetical protein